MNKFFCWSPPLWRKIINLGIEPIKMFYNEERKKSCKVFKLNDELSLILEDWRENRPVINERECDFD